MIDSHRSAESFRSISPEDELLKRKRVLAALQEEADKVSLVTFLTILWEEHKTFDTSLTRIAGGMKALDKLRAYKEGRVECRDPKGKMSMILEVLKALPKP